MGDAALQPRERSAGALTVTTDVFRIPYVNADREET